MHFEGRANIWFRFYQASRGFVPWRMFVDDVVLRFENPENRDVQDLFNKLKQTGTVAEYEDQFEELRALVMAQNRGFNEEYFVSSFVSGLKEHIKGAVKMFRPQTLSHVIFLAKQEEVKGGKESLVQTTKPVNRFPVAITKDMPTPIASNYKASGLKDQRNAKSRLSSREIMERIAKGLCFHCDENYHPGARL